MKPISINDTNYSLHNTDNFKKTLDYSSNEILSKYSDLLTEYLKNNRSIGAIDKTVSIIFDIFSRSIKINCDGGRMYRPLLKVIDNTIQLNDKMIRSISLKQKQIGKIDDKVYDWNQFIHKYNNVIEYIDIEEAEHTMIAMYPQDVDKEYIKMNTKIDNPNINGSIVNRYNDTVYVKYTHCELHPMLMLGVITSNIPFANHNQSVRDYYNFQLSRQGISIYSTNYRERVDLSYTMYNPQIPLIRTINSKYTNSIHMPFGVNVIVAIACYTGMNQEDSLIFNRSSLDRGLFRAAVFKKYDAVLKKNSTTTQDDEFMKPDKRITANMKDGNYDKLNNLGYIPEETVIENGDIIIGKVSPIQGDSEKKYIDQSEVFKSNVNGVVDRVYVTFDSEEHKTYNIKVRSERYPVIGDKFCLLGTSQVLTNQGWINFEELYDRVKINNEELLVAQLVDNKYINYVKPIDVYKFEYIGKMYKLRSDYVDLDVTIDHKMYVKLDNKKEYELISAKEIIGKSVEYTNLCTNNMNGIQYEQFIKIKEIEDIPQYLHLLSSFQSIELLYIFEDKFNDEINKTNFDN